MPVSLGTSLQVMVACLFALVLLLATPAARAAEGTQPSDPNAPQDIFLLIGQSNMAGRAAILQEDLDPVDGAFLFTGRGWEPLRNPVNRYSTVIAGDPTSRLGPGYTFARRLVERTGRRIGIVSNARGGTRIIQWQKGYDGDNDFDLYEQAVARAKMALEMTPGARLVGIIWHQGEGDNSSGAASQYMNRLRQLVTDLRTDLNSPDATLIIGEVGMWSGRGLHVNPVIRQVERHIENAYWVTAAGLVPLPLSDGSPNMADPHFNTLSQRVLGLRYADKALEKIYGIDPGGVTLFAANELHDGVNFTGYSATFPPGTYDAATLLRHGIVADNLRSAQIESGYELIIHTSEGDVQVTQDTSELALSGTVTGVTVRAVEE